MLELNTLYGSRTDFLYSCFKFFSFSIFLNLFYFVISFIYLFVSINNVPLLVLKIMEHVPYLNLMNLFEIVSFTSWLFCIYIDCWLSYFKPSGEILENYPKSDHNLPILYTLKTQDKEKFLHFQGV